MPKKLPKQMRHAKYWRDRNDDIIRWLDEQDLDIFKELQDVYSEVSTNVQKKLYEFYGKYATDNNISFKEAQIRLRREDLSDYQKNAKKYFEEAENMTEDEAQRLLDRLNEQYQASKATRLDALRLDIMNEIGRMNTFSLQSIFTDYLSMVGEYAYLQSIDPSFSSSTLNRPAIKELISRPWNGYNYSEDLWGNTDNLADKLFNTLKKGFVSGSGVQDMAREIRKDFNVSRSSAETLVRTDGSHVVNNATLKRYQDTFGLKRIKIHVHVDSRTTEICMGYYEADESYLIGEEPKLPAHYNCRSTYVPDESELTKEHWL